MPTSAILRNDENLPFVYVEVQPGQFGQRSVTPGAQQGDETETTSGAKAGEKIVSKAAFFFSSRIAPAKDPS